MYHSILNISQTLFNSLIEEMYSQLCIMLVMECDVTFFTGRKVERDGNIDRFASVDRDKS